MNIKEFLTKLFFLLALTPALYSQSDTLTRQDKPKAIAFEQIRSLKQGALIIRLKTRQNNIDAYRNAGLDDIADRIEKEQRTENLYMVRAFKNFYTFSEVYFMYIHGTDSFLNGAYSGLFLDSNLVIDPSLSFSDTNFLFLERGPVKSKVMVDGRQMKEGFTYDPNSAISDALVVKDRNGNQLFAPFPYYIAAPAKLDKYYVSVNKVNKKFTSFWNKATMY